MILVFDTNVFLQRQANLFELQEYFEVEQPAPKFWIGVDEDGDIFNEYADQATLADIEDPVRIIYKRISDLADIFIRPLPAELSPELKSCLEENGCILPIEPQLFGVTETSGKQGILVCPNDNTALRITREYLKTGVLDKIHRKLLQVPDREKFSVHTLAEILKLIREPGEHTPQFVSELQALLKKHSIKSQSGQEREYIEFKGPKYAYLSRLLLRKTVQAVCGMLNRRTGWVFIGVDAETGKVKLFPPKYNDRQGTKSPNVDQLIQDINNEIKRIIPNPIRLVDVWPVLDDTNQTDNCAIAILVRRGTQEYLYGDKDYIENEAQPLNPNKLVKWIRVGTSTIIDPDWLSARQ